MVVVFKPFFVLYFLIVFLVGMPLCSLATVTSSPIPLDSWVYPALDKLSGLGLVDSALMGSRPYSRLEAARQVDEATSAVERVSALPVALELLHLLQNELTDSLAELHGEADLSGYLKPVRQLGFNYIYRDGADSTIAGNGVDAQQFSLTYNNAGIAYADGSNVQSRLLGEARIGGLLQFDWEPLLISSSGDSFDLQWQHVRAAIGLGAFELSVGRQSLWWGQGHHGSLVLTNNAKPFDMVRITNPSPILLPWVLKYLGPFRLDLFWSQMEKNRVIPEPYFAGMRVNIKPLPWVEIGASRGVMFGGEGRPEVEWKDFLTILGGENLVGGEDTSNSVAAIDARIRLPFLAGTEIYGEYGGEDESNHFLAASAWLAGIYLPKVEPSGRLSLRLEYADLSKIDNLAPPWYRHGIYRSGYTYEGRILGHHVGGAAEDLFVEAELLLRNDIRLTLSFDFESRGVDQPVIEEHQQTQLTADWNLNDHLSLNLSFGYDQVENVNYEDNNNQNFSLATFGVQGQW